MSHPSTSDALLRRWVETWRSAGEELEHLRRTEIQSIDTREAIRQIFPSDSTPGPAAPPTSGLVEQQSWFARIRSPRRRP